MRVLITGSRDWTDIDAIWGALDILAEQARELGEELVAVHGGAEGADSIAHRWARERRALMRWPVFVERYPAAWKRHGKKAGYLRNQAMVDLGADVCLAFILDGSKGASMCAALAEAAGIPVQRIERETT